MLQVSERREKEWGKNRKNERSFARLSNKYYVMCERAMHVVKNDAKGKLLRPRVAQPNGFFTFWLVDNISSNSIVIRRATVKKVFYATFDHTVEIQLNVICCHNAHCAHCMGVMLLLLIA